MLEITMNQLLKRRSDAEHAIKDLESLYTQTVVKVNIKYPLFLIYFDSQNLYVFKQCFRFLEVCCTFQRESLRQVQQDPCCPGW